MPTPDCNWRMPRPNERFWTSLSDMHSSNVEDQKGLAASVANAIAAQQERAAVAAGHVGTAKDRIERISRGDDLQGGLGKSAALDDILKDAGFTSRDFRHMERVGAISKVGDGAVKELLEECKKRSEQAYNAAVSAVFRKYYAPEEED